MSKESRLLPNKADIKSSKNNLSILLTKDENNK